MIEQETTYRIRGLKLTLADLGALMAKCRDLPGDSPVRVHIDRVPHPSPTDPGGTITIEVRG